MSFANSAATVPEPCFIFGTSLRPFCLGHHLLFRRMGLPFCGNPLEVITTDDALLGVAICGQNYNDTLEQFLTGQWERVFARWQRQLRGGWWRHRKLNEAALNDGKILFRAYLEDGYQKVPLWKYESKGGISLSAPWEMALKNRLVMAGYTEADVLNGYLPAKWYDYYAVLELDSAARCKDEKKWRRVFYTAEDHALISRKEAACH